MTEQTPNQIFTFPPYTRTGMPTFFNWLNATQSGYPGPINDDTHPGNGPYVFETLWKKKLAGQVEFATGELYCKNGKNAPAGDSDRILVSGNNQIPWLFKHTYRDKPRWEASWRGYYINNNNWNQYFNCHVYNDTDTLYPFATKGISFRIRVPASDDEINWSGTSDNDNYGNHMQINKAWGLWRDLDGVYYVYRMYCHGDNRYLVSGSNDGDGDEGKIRPKEGLPGTQSQYPDRQDNIAREWWGDRYFFLEKESAEITTGTDDNLDTNIIAKGKEKGVTMFTNEPIVENLFFCGFQIEWHLDHQASSKRFHSSLISRLLPVPFYSPRHDDRYMAVLGAPTSLVELRKGNRKVLLWNPPDAYYAYEDNLQFDDTIPKEDTYGDEGEERAVDVGTVFVDENGDGIPIPANIFFTEEGLIIINGKGEVTTTDGSIYFSRQSQGQRSDVLVKKPPFDDLINT